MHYTGKGSGVTLHSEVGREQFFYFNKTGSVSGTSFANHVAVIKIGTERAFESCNV